MLWLVGVAEQKESVSCSLESEIVSILNRCVLGGGDAMKKISDGVQTTFILGLLTKLS